MPTSERVNELDTLRALASGGVLLFHLFPGPFYFAWMGVDLFFVLSGFLITDGILRDKAKPTFFKDFYVRRTLRIWPIYYLAILIALVLAKTSRTIPPLEGLPFALTFTQSIPEYWGAVRPVFTYRMGHLWTLAIEEQFYLVWPALLLWGGARKIPLFVALALGICFLARLHLPVDLLATRADGLAFGALLAYLWRTQFAHLRAVSACLIVAALTYGALGTLYMGKPFLDTVPAWPGPTILMVNCLAFSLVALALTFRGRWAVLSLRPFTYTGKLSYGLYLYHPLVFWVLDALQLRMHWNRSPLFLGMCMGLSYAVAAISWEWIEKPILALKPLFQAKKNPGLFKLAVLPESRAGL